MCPTLAHVTQPRKRAAEYLRLSRDPEGSGLGVDRQQPPIRALCERLGLEVVGSYVDNHLSASRFATRRRPRWDELVAAVRAGEVDTIVAYSNSRLTRRPREYEDVIDLVEQTGVEIRTVVSGAVDLSTADGRMIGRMLAAADAAEAERISERSRLERAQRRARGLPNGGTRPFGFEANGVTPREAEYAAIVRGAADVLAGVPLAQVARAWSAAKGSTVAAPTVRRVLLSERVAGRLPDGKPAVWPAVIDADQVVALRALLSRPVPVRAAEHFLTGLALCGKCRAPVHGAVTRLGASAYTCSAAAHLKVRRAERDAWVQILVADYLDREGLAAAADTAPLTTRHAALTAQLGEVADMLADAELTREQAARASDRLRARLDTVEAELAAATRTSMLPETGAAFLALPTYRQRQVLAAVPWRVILDPPGRGARKFDPATVRTVRQ